MISHNRFKLPVRKNVTVVYNKNYLLVFLIFIETDSGLFRGRSFNLVRIFWTYVENDNLNS